MITATKEYKDIPFAHRQHAHDGHCALIHGHNWSFEFTFGCLAGKTDACDFVIDFGKLGWLKQWINDKFDHTLVMNADDPALKYLTSGLVDPAGTDEKLRTKFPFAKITVVPSCSCEGLCKYLATQLAIMLYHDFKDRVFLVSVTVHEDSKNSATFNLTRE